MEVKFISVDQRTVHLLFAADLQRAVPDAEAMLEFAGDLREKRIVGMTFRMAHMGEEIRAPAAQTHSQANHR